MEVACDESGYEGQKLVGGTTDVFAHAGVRLDFEAATECVHELRNRIRSPATEYKATHVLREKHRPVLIWLLGPSGPLHGSARVFLIDKTFFVVDRVVDLLVGQPGPVVGLETNAPAVTLYREGQRAFGNEQWQALLAAANDLMRATDRLDVTTSVDSFFRTIDSLLRTGPSGPAAEILALLRQARPLADSYRARLLERPQLVPALDPLIPALVRAVDYWGEGRHAVSIVHDRQNTLSAWRIAQLKELVSGPEPKGRLSSLTLVGSTVDARVQVADFLAGVARKVASDQLNDRGDAELTDLLRPYLDPYSIWADERSWSRLAPAST
ncbi:MAG TPA: hypothetical protein VFT31_16035 [Kribbella sp.]|nr:hypothetical protein [Kribbella sp.]